MQNHSVSIIVCTYNRYDILDVCIEKINNSVELDKENCELIVIDNTPEKNRRNVNLRGKGVLYYCEQTGLSFARNLGIEKAKGEIIIFLDDDALIYPGYITACHEAFKDPSRLVVGGAVQPLFERDLPFWYYDNLSYYLSCVDWSDYPRYLNDGEWIVGANMAFRKEFFLKYGYFATNLGRSGVAGLLSNEEVAIMDSYGKKNIWYQPNMSVQHIISNERLTLSWFRKRVFWQAVSDVLGNLSHISRKEAAESLDQRIANFHPRYRGLKTFFREPITKIDFEQQLKGLYEYIRCAAEGEY